MPITRLSGGSTPADGSDPRTFPAIWNPTADLIEANETDVAALQALVGDNNLNDINDVEITAPADGQFLVYDNGDWVNSVPAGTILQVVSTTKTDTFSTTSTSYVDITGFSLTITPSSSANKVLVMANPSLGASTGNEISLVIDRDGTDISVSSTSNTGVTFPRSEFGIDEASILFLDSPASAAAVTYKLQMKVSTGTGFLNRRGVNADIIATSTMMLMEVAG